jgi:threonine dehydrogenase-like Zn-dependent dehydrogenase
MRALVLDGHTVRLQPDYPEPVPKPGETLVSVITAGICETDLQLIGGYMDFRGVPGHEFVGVAQTGPYAGQRVVGEINCSCGHCPACHRGHATHCANRTVLGILRHDGAFADRIAVPQRNLHPVPDTLPSDAAVFAEPVAAAFQIPEQIAVSGSDRVIVLGDGRLGNLCAQVLAGLSRHVLVVGKHPEKLTVLQALGVATALLADVTDRRVADIVVDCTGSESGLPTALELVRPRGTIVLKTTIAGRQTLAWAPFVIDEVTLVGSRCGPFAPALAALDQGRISVAPLIAQRFDLADGVEALSRAQVPGVLKVLLDVAQAQ